MMHPPKIEREKNGRIECTVEFSKEEVKAAEEKALAALSEQVKIQGFRPGKAPREMLLGKINPDDLTEETIHRLLPETMESLVKEQKIQTIISPKVALKKRDPLTLSIIFVERPTVTIKGIDKIKIDKKTPKVEEKDVDRMAEFILRKHETATEVDRGAQEKDCVTMNFWGADSEGKEIAPIRTQGHAVVLGSRSLIPGFEEALLGAKKGEEKAFTLTFPKDYHAKELSEKPVTFHVTVTKVEEVKIPELTDAFVKEHLHVESAGAFRKELQSSMVAQEEHLDHQRREQELMTAIGKAAVVNLPKELIEEEERSILSDMEEQLKRQGKSLQDWMEMTKKKPEDVKKELEERARERLTLRLGIRELLEVKQIIVSDDEMREAVSGLLSPLSEKERVEVEPAYAKGEQAYDQLKWQKRVEKLFEQMLAA
ncbi:MAG: trigger factor [Candidatus Peribacteraceae bacterium]|nr:trigger factor [Candidatus Peribacteraceae bacterium]MDD5739860.1 trigger factor [Candidatus Peribacteraceae bacterium]